MSILGAVVGGLFSAYAAKKASQRQGEAMGQANDANIAEAERNRLFQSQEAEIGRRFVSDQFNSAQAFNAAEADKNRQFQADMSNTSYQRAVGDMKAAGLNPMLAYSQGGASAASGGAASIGATGGPVASGSATPALQAVSQMGTGEALLNSASQMIDIDRKLQENDLLRERKIQMGEQTHGVSIDNMAKAVDLKWLERNWENRMISAQHDNALKGFAHQLELERQQYYHRRAKGEITEQELKVNLLELERRATENGMPESETMRDYWKKFGMTIPITREAEGIVNSAASVIGSAAKGIIGGLRKRGGSQSPSRSYSETHYDKDGNVVRGMSRDYQE